MIRCCVKNCDTDENVVNCTSVFFVGFPVDALLRNHWLEVLSSTLRDDFDGPDSGKICSCHFGEDAFGKHPVHGYRFLLPGAVPSVFPMVLEELLPPEPEEEDDLGHYVDDIVEEEELITFGEAEEEEPQVEDQVPPAEVVEYVPEEELLEEEPALQQAAKTIGIEYADGKYYFLQSEDESDEELVERDSQISLPEDPRAIILEDPEVAQDKGAAFNFELIPKSEVFPLKTETEPEADVSTEMDSLITTSEFVEEEGPLLSSMSYQEASRITVKQEPADFIVVDHKAPQSTGLTESRMVEEEMVEGKGNVKGKEKKVFKHFCPQCSKGFQYESGLKKHLLVHNGLKPHSCETCGKSFSQKINLTIHLRRHTGEEPLKKFTCPVCQKKCIRMSELKLHLKSHWRKLPHACPLCTERYSDVTNFYDHIKTVHKEELTLQEAIDMIAQNENAEVIVPGAMTVVVKDHQDEAMPPLPDSVMLDEGFYTCTVCVKTFRTERMLRKHKRKLHPKVFVCLHCPKQFLYKSLLEKHSRVHTQEKPFFCEFCQTPFSQKINLEVHLVKRHNISVAGKAHVAQKNLACPCCPKMFDRPSALTNHLRTHDKSREPRERPFVCKDCPKTFASSGTLAGHVRTHHRGKSILLHPAKRLSMTASSSNTSIGSNNNYSNSIVDAATGGFVVLPESTNGGREDVVSVVSTAGEEDDGGGGGVNVIRYSIQFITPSEQGEDVGV